MKKKVRVTTEKSNPPWNGSAKQGRDNEYTRGLKNRIAELEAQLQALVAGNTASMLLWCPECGLRHVDIGDFATKIHHTHACQGCGHVWRPALHATFGVQFLPGFKNPMGTS